MNPLPKPEHIYLIPGFLSPRWMMLPLGRHLRQYHGKVVAWDYPRVLARLDDNIDALLALFEQEVAADRPFAVVTHSFGDWLGRSALARAPLAQMVRLVSISPVVTVAPAARLLRPAAERIVSEIAIMADQEKAASALELSPMVEHTVLWSRWDWWVRRPDPWPGLGRSRHETISGTHNSVLFQPNLWRRVRHHLNSDSSAETFSG